MDGHQWNCKDYSSSATASLALRREVRGHTEHHLVGSLTSARTAGKAVFFLLDHCRDIQQEPRIAQIDQPKNSNLRTLEWRPYLKLAIPCIATQLRINFWTYPSLQPRPSYWLTLNKPRNWISMRPVEKMSTKAGWLQNFT